MLRVAVVILLTLGAGSAGAESEVEAAKREEATARRAFAEKRFERAAEAFHRADALAPRAATKYNEALSLQRAGRAAEAAEAFVTALERDDLPKGLRKRCEQRLAELEAELGLVVIEKPRGALISIAHVRERPVPTQVYLSPGAHTITIVLADGRALRREVSARAGATLVIDVAPPPAPTPAIVSPPPVPEETLLLLPTGFVFLGLAAAGTGAAVGLGVATLDRRDAFVAGGRLNPAQRDDIFTLRDATNVSWLVAGLTGLTGGILVVTALATGDDDSQASLSLAPSRLDLTVVW